MNVIKNKTVMVQGFTNKLKQYPSGNMRGTGCHVETSKNDYQSETKTVMVQGEYGEAQITKDKFWNVNGTMTNKLKTDPSWSFNHSSSNVDRIGCCADTSKNYYLGNMLPKHIGSIAAKDQLTSKQNRKKKKPPKKP